MNSTTHDLNLARKWRPNSFDSIVGQEIPVKMLKNSLYLNKFFPVYLFAGQRGCGKTSTARIFAAASNCFQLTQFQQNPTLHQLPCLSCQSCKLMQAGNHPDFIEIDAASNTGVDNVRQLIDTASYVPLIGSKKIFLIDEAHMLSKAAFNAFLKILEEPPKSVLFILATTELHKIPQTVLSRCFHVTFSLLDRASLSNHLRSMCTQEDINIDAEAIDAIIQETEGSARDAINLLEQVRFAHTHITASHVLALLGKLSNDVICSLVRATIEQNPHKLVATLTNAHFDSVNPETIWQSITECYKAILWLKYNASIEKTPLAPLTEELSTLANTCSHEFILFALQKLWDQEAIFIQTNKKQAFLEIVLVQLCSFEASSTTHKPHAEPIAKPNLKTPPVAKALAPATQPVSAPRESTPPVQTAPQEPTTTRPESMSNANEPAAWTNAKQSLGNANGDPIATSILLQATVDTIDQETQTLKLALNQNNKFFNDALDAARSWWQPLILQYFSGITTITFVQAANTTTVARKQPTANPVAAESTASLPAQQETRTIDQKDWPIATMIKKHLPGKIKKSQLSNA